MDFFHSKFLRWVVMPTPSASMTSRGIRVVLSLLAFQSIPHPQANSFQVGRFENCMLQTVVVYCDLMSKCRSRSKRFVVKA